MLVGAPTLKVSSARSGGVLPTVIPTGQRKTGAIYELGGTEVVLQLEQTPDAPRVGGQRLDAWGDPGGPTERASDERGRRLSAAACADV